MSVRTINPWHTALAVSLATFMEVLDTTITNVSLSHIAGSLSSGYEEATWLLTSYLVANGIIIPLSGWIGGVMGQKKYYIRSILFFTIASFFCGAATSLNMLIFYRLLQGAAGGGLQPTQQAILLDIFPPEKRAQAYALTGMTMVVAPALGPALGGWITDNFSWRWIFYINVPVGALAIFLVNRLYFEPERPPMPEEEKKTDWVGLSLIVLGIGALQYVLDHGQSKDWFSSRAIGIATIIAAVCCGGAVTWLQFRKAPLIDFKLLRFRSFRVACIMIFFVGFALYGSSLLMPMMVQRLYGYDASLAGLVLSPGALCVLFLMPIGAKITQYIPLKYLIGGGFSLMAAGLFYTMRLSPETDMQTFVQMRIMTVIGMPFLFIPISALAFIDVPKELNGKASALYSMFRNIGGSVGIATVTTTLVRHAQSWQTSLANHTNLYDPQMQNAMFDKALALKNAGMPPASIQPMTSALLYQSMQQQAMYLSFMDSFELIAFIMLALVVLAMTLPAVRASGDASAAH